MRAQLRAACGSWREFQCLHHRRREGLLLFRHHESAAPRCEDGSRTELRGRYDGSALRHGLEKHQPLGFGARREYEGVTGGITVREFGASIEIADESHRVLDSKLARPT